MALGPWATKAKKTPGKAVQKPATQSPVDVLPPHIREAIKPKPQPDQNVLSNLRKQAMTPTSSNPNTSLKKNQATISVAGKPRVVTFDGDSAPSGQDIKDATLIFLEKDHPKLYKEYEALESSRLKEKDPAKRNELNTKIANLIHSGKATGQAPDDGGLIGQGLSYLDNATMSGADHLQQAINTASRAIMRGQTPQEAGETFKRNMEGLIGGVSNTLNSAGFPNQVDPEAATGMINPHEFRGVKDILNPATTLNGLDQQAMQYNTADTAGKLGIMGDVGLHAGQDALDLLSPFHNKLHSPVISKITSRVEGAVKGATNLLSDTKDSIVTKVKKSLNIPTLEHPANPANPDRMTEIAQKIADGKKMESIKSKMAEGKAEQANGGANPADGEATPPEPHFTAGHDPEPKTETTQKPQDTQKVSENATSGQTGSNEKPKFAASNLSSEHQRESMGQEPRVKGKPITRKELESNPVDNSVTHELASNIVRDVESGKPARAISAKQQVDLGRVEAESAKELSESKKALANAIKEGKDISELEQKHGDLVARQMNLIKANEYSGAEQSATFRSRNYAWSDLDTHEGVYNEGIIQKGADLSGKEHAKLTDLVTKLDEHKAKIDELQASNDDLKKAVEEYKKSGKSPNPTPGRRIARSDIEIKASRENSLNAIKASMGGKKLGANDPFGVAEVDLKAVGDYALTFVEQGVGKVEDIVNLAHKSLTDAGVNLTKGDVQQALVDWATPKKKARELDSQIMFRDKTRREIRNALNDLKQTKTQRIVNEAIAIPRGLQATADLSATLRQGLILGAGNPKKAAVAFGKALKAFADPVFAAKVDRALYESPMALTRKKAGLYISDAGSGLNLAEEAFMSHALGNLEHSKIPGVKQFGQLHAASERHYTTFLNQLRSSVFDGIIAKNPTLPLADQKAVANFINIASGRGNLPVGTSKPLSYVLFSPRFTASRLEAPFQLFSKSAITRKEAAKSYASLLSAGTVLMGLAKMNGAELTSDPSDPDFGKIKFGNTRFDIWGGEQQVMRLFANLAKRATTTDPAKYNQGSMDSINKFVRYKFSPVPNILLGALDKKDAVGQPMFRNKEGDMNAKTIGEDALKPLIPLSFKDIAEAVNNDNSGLLKTLGVGAAVLGMGINTYQKTTTPRKKPGSKEGREPKDRP